MTDPRQHQFAFHGNSNAPAPSQSHDFSMKKQPNPNEVQYSSNNPNYGNQSAPQHHLYQSNPSQGDYLSSANPVISQNRFLGSNNNVGQGGQGNPHGHIVVHQPHPVGTSQQGAHYNQGGLHQQQPINYLKISSNSGAPKTLVEESTTYPKPNQNLNLFKMFAEDPSQFDEFLTCKINNVVNNRVNKKLGDFKNVMKVMLEEMGKANSGEVTTLNTQVLGVEKNVSTQEKQIDSINNKLELLNSKINLLESQGVDHKGKDAQIENLERLRENMRAEINVILNEKLLEQNTVFEEKIEKKLEEADKKGKTYEKRFETIKIDSDQSKKDTENLMNKLTELQKIIQEIGTHKNKDQGDRIDQIESTVKNSDIIVQEIQRQNQILTHEIEENKQTYLVKLDNLEKYVQTLRESREKELQELKLREAPKQQSNLQLNQNVLEDIRKVKDSNDHFSYKIEAIKYDIDLMKEDIVRQKRNQKDYFDKIDKLERIVESGQKDFGGNRSLGQNSGNFMNNASRATNEMLNYDDHNSKGYHQYPLVAEKVNLQNNYFNEDSFELGLEKGYDYGKGNNNFDFNLSMIGNNNPGVIQNTDQSELFDCEEYTNLMTKDTKNNFSKNPYGQPKRVDSLMEPIKEVDHSKEDISTAGINTDSDNSYKNSMKNYPEPNVAKNPLPYGNPVSTPPVSRPPLPPTGGEGGIYNNAGGGGGYTGPARTSNYQGGGNPNNMSKLGERSLINQSLNGSVRLSKGVFRRNIGEASVIQGDDSDEIELNIDENGFLIDAQGFPILNDKGEPMKLTEDNIEFLREQGLYEEVEVSTDNILAEDDM